MDRSRAEVGGSSSVPFFSSTRFDHEGRLPTATCSGLVQTLSHPREPAAEGQESQATASPLPTCFLLPLLFPTASSSSPMPRPPLKSLATPLRATAHLYRTTYAYRTRAAALPTALSPSSSRSFNSTASPRGHENPLVRSTLPPPLHPANLEEARRASLETMLLRQCLGCSAVSRQSDG